MRYISDATNPFRPRGEDVILQSRAAARFARAGTKQDFVHYPRINRRPRGIGTYPSLAMQVSFPYFSGFELAFLQFLDILAGVVFWPQPLKFRIVIDGKAGIYTPDCGVLFEGRRIMFETKFQYDAESPKHKDRWPAIEAELQSCGYDFKQIDETSFLEPRFVERLQALQRFRRVEFDDLASFQLQSRLSSKPCWRLDEVLAEIAALGQHEDMFFASIIRRQLYIDFWEPINEATEVFPARNAPFPAILKD